MFTKADRAIVALIMAVIFLLTHFGIIDVTDAVSEEMVTGIVAPFIVWLTPNKKD